MYTQKTIYIARKDIKIFIVYYVWCVHLSCFSQKAIISFLGSKSPYFARLIYKLYPLDSQNSMKISYNKTLIIGVILRIQNIIVVKQTKQFLVHN